MGRDSPWSANPGHRAMSDLDRNLRLYRVFVLCASAYAWLPVFFLYFSSRVTLPEVLWLEAAYYAAVALLEVPSGYLSDRLGRRPTLILTALSLTASYLAFFLIGTGFWGLLLAQVLLAAAIAGGSGTDTSFHLDTLTALGRAGEYGPREARLGRAASWSTAAAAVLGGALGSVSLGWAYMLSAVAAAGALAAAVGFVEPPTWDAQAAHRRLSAQLRACADLLRRPSLRWCFGFAIAMIVANHVPYEFYQTYLDLLNARGDLGGWLQGRTSAVAGLHVAAVSFVGGWVAGHSVAIARRLGTRRALLLSGILQVGLILAMAALLHPLIAALLMLRGVPGAMARAPLNEAVVPQVPSKLRATYLSVQSLAGRLSYAVVLVALSWFIGEESSPEGFRRTLLAAMVVCLGGWLMLWLWRPSAAEPEA